MRSRNSLEVCKPVMRYYASVVSYKALMLLLYENNVMLFNAKIK